jgi:hypothetical protein
MDAPHMLIRDVKLLNTGTGQSVAVEFGDGQVKTFTARDLYEASRMLKPSAKEAETKTASQRRAEEFLAMKRSRR